MRKPSSSRSIAKRSQRSKSCSTMIRLRSSSTSRIVLFDDQARQPDVGIVVATGEARVFANVLVTIGVVPADA